MKIKSLKNVAIGTLLCSCLSMAWKLDLWGQVVGVFSTITATGPISVSGTGTFSGANGSLAYGRAGIGDMDFVAANGGASPAFEWYFLLGSTPTVEMSLGTTGILTVNNGIDTNHVSATSVATTVFTFATLPSAAISGVGTHVTISDGSGAANAACAGGGSNFMLAISNGTTWSCH
jgi:hypothetical protein